MIFWVDLLLSRRINQTEGCHEVEKQDLGRSGSGQDPNTGEDARVRLGDVLDFLRSIHPQNATWNGPDRWEHAASRIAAMHAEGKL